MPGVVFIAGILVVGASGCLYGSTNAWASCTLVQAPCLVSPSPAPGQLPLPVPSPQSSLSFERTCNAYYNGAPAIPATLTRPIPVPSYPGLIAQIQSQLQKNASCYYQGVDPNPFVPNPKNTACPGDPSWGTPCSLVPNPLNSNSPSEVTQNYRHISCGNLMPITPVINDNGCPADGTSASLTPPSDVAAALAALPNPPSISRILGLSQSGLQTLYQRLIGGDPKLASSIQNASNGKSICMYMSKSATDGEAERSWFRGAFIQALSYYMNQVIKEVTTTNELQVPTGSPCTAIAADYSSLLKKQTMQSRNTINALVSQMADPRITANIGDIANCTADWNALPVAPGGDVDRGHLRQSAQYLCSSRTGIESAFVELSVCEIFERTQNDFALKAGGNDGQHFYPDIQYFMIQAEKTIEQPPYGLNDRRGCRQDCSGKHSMDDLKTCINQCYQQNISRYMQSKFQTWWPPSSPVPFSCLGISLLGPLFPGIAEGDRKRLRRRRRKLPRRLPMRRLVMILILLLSSWIISGCGSNPNIPAVPVPPPNGGCDGASCNVGGSGVIEATQVGAGSALSGSTGDLTSANSLIGNGHGLSTAAAQSPGAPPSGAGPGIAGGIYGGGGPSNLAAGSGGFAGGAAAGGGSMSPFSYGNDAGSNPAGSNGTGAQSGQLTASYSGAGGSGGSGAKQNQFNFSGFAGIDDGELTGTSGQDAYGRDIPPMANRDPANYFTMIDPNESLFKKVTDRYQETAIHWASATSITLGREADIHGGVISLPRRK